MEAQPREAQPREAYLKKKRNYHNSVSYHPKEHQTACQHFKQHEAKLLEYAPIFPPFKLPDKEIRISAPGPEEEGQCHCHWQ